MPFQQAGTVIVQPSQAAVTVNASAPTVNNNVTATTPASMTTTNLYAAQVYGNGSDGDVTIAAGSTVTLIRDAQYNNLTVAGTLDCNGFRLLVAGTLTVQAGGLVHNDGDVGSGSTPYAGGAGGQTGTLPGGYPGGTGNSAGISTNMNAPATTAADVMGGSGGSVSPATAGATTPTKTALYLDTASLTVRSLGGGGGGSGGSWSGGGGGGGVLMVCARTVSNAGRISANGGNGGDVSTTTSSSGTYASGSGGGGGLVVCISNAYTGNAPQALGGNPGNPNTVGGSTRVVAGAAGQAGKVVQLQVAA